METRFVIVTTNCCRQQEDLQTPHFPKFVLTLRTHNVELESKCQWYDESHLRQSRLYGNQVFLIYSVYRDGFDHRIFGRKMDGIR